MQLIAFLLIFGRASPEPNSNYYQTKKNNHKGWLSQKPFQAYLKPHYFVKDELRVKNVIILRDRRIIIQSNPTALASQRIHKGHLGFSERRLRARDGLVAGISRAIENMVNLDSYVSGTSQVFKFMFCYSNQMCRIKITLLHKFYSKFYQACNFT